MNDYYDDDDTMTAFCREIFVFIDGLDEQSLSKIISTSFKNLSDVEKKFMQAMSVFPGEILLPIVNMGVIRVVGQWPYKSKCMSFFYI